MKTVFKVLSMLLMMTALSLGTVSCGDDDDDEPTPAQTTNDDNGGSNGNGSTTSNSIIGSWEWEDGYEYEVYTFDTNGTFVCEYGDYYGTYSDYGRYTFSNNVLKLIAEEETITFRVSFSGNTMTWVDVEDGETQVFTRINLDD